jgi:hypothetical protein
MPPFQPTVSHHMKKLLLLLAIPMLLAGLVLPSPCHAAAASKRSVQISLPEGTDPEVVRDAGNKAVKDLVARFCSEPGGAVRRFAVLPFETDVDGNYFTNRVRDQLSVAGKPAGIELYTRMDEEWDRMLDEIGVGQKFEDTMDPATVQKFGKIAGVQGIVIGKVVSVTKEGSDAKVRLSFRALEVETGRQVWAGESAQYAKRDGSLLNQVERLGETDGLKKYWWIGSSALAGLYVLSRVIRAISSATRPR